MSHYLRHYQKKILSYALPILLAGAFTGCGLESVSQHDSRVAMEHSVLLSTLEQNTTLDHFSSSTEESTNKKTLDSKKETTKKKQKETTTSKKASKKASEKEASSKTTSAKESVLSSTPESTFLEETTFWSDTDTASVSSSWEDPSDSDEGAGLEQGTQAPSFPDSPEKGGDYGKENAEVGNGPEDSEKNTQPPAASTSKTATKEASQSNATQKSTKPSQTAAPTQVPQTEATEATTTAQTSVTATLSVTCQSIDQGALVSPISATLQNDATAFDLLQALCSSNGVALDYENSAYGVYVKGIGHIYEKDYGGLSGWLYKVNGSTPSISCGSYKLKEGDVVEFFYNK